MKKKKHGFQETNSNQHAFKAHPYEHPYLVNNNKQPNPYPQRTPEMVANNTYYAEETRAPTKISVGPNVERAPTTISVPPQIGGVQDGSGIGAQFHRPSQNSYDVARDINRASTTISVPPVRDQVQYGDGVTIKINDEDDEEDMDTDDEDDTDEDDEEEQGPGVFDVLLDISKTFNYLKDLRKQYRDLLPQLKEMKKDDMGCFLRVYSHVKTNIIEEQDGLEGTYFKKQHGKGVTESEGETDEETDNEEDGNDADTEDGDETDEETVDTEEEEAEENDDDDE